MNPLHLFWIIPLSAFAGYITALLMIMAAACDEDEEKEYSGLLTDD